MLEINKCDDCTCFCYTNQLPVVYPKVVVRATSLTITLEIVCDHSSDIEICHNLIKIARILK